MSVSIDTIPDGTVISFARKNGEWVHEHSGSSHRATTALCEECGLVASVLMAIRAQEGSDAES